MKSYLPHFRTQLVAAAFGESLHTIIPDKFRPFDTNKAGLYPHPVPICVGPMGKFLFLDYSPIIKKESRLCLADFHNPVRVTVVRSGLKNAKSLTHLQGKGITLLLEGELNGPFAAGSHMVQNPPCWRASYALGHPKQRKCKFVLMKSLCSGCPSGQLALQHGGFCTM